MNLSDVVNILQVGLSGLAFLLAFLGYWLIAREQQAEKPRPAMLKSAKYFLFQCIGLAVIVGIFQIAPRFIPLALDQQQVGTCRDSFDLLSLRVQRNGNYENLLEAVKDHQSSCAQLIIKLDER